MNARLAAFLTAAHAARWRQRYGGEFRALLEELPPTPATVASAAGSAVASQLPVLGALGAFALVTALLALGPSASDRLNRPGAPATPAAGAPWAANTPCRARGIRTIAREDVTPCKLG
jgi:hypothetical protein